MTYMLDIISPESLEALRTPIYPYRSIKEDRHSGMIRLLLDVALHLPRVERFDNTSCVLKYNQTKVEYLQQLVG